MARRAAHFTIHSLDANGWRRREGGEPFVVSIRGPGAVTTSVRDCQDGTYSCGWVASVSGVYWIVISLHGEHIAGSPFSAQVTVPHADAKQCKCAGIGLHEAVAGESASFRVEFADIAGRAVPAESLDLALDTVGGGGRKDAAVASGFSLGGLSPIDGGPEGTYTARYSVNRSGVYELHVRLRTSAEPLGGSPFVLTVRSGHAHAPTTELPIDDAPIRSIAAVEDRLVLRAVDRLHNPCDAGADGLTAEVVPADGTADDEGYDSSAFGVGGVHSGDVKVHVKDRGDGSYEVAWRGERAGSYRLAVRLRGAHVGKSPALLRLLSAPPDPRACSLHGDGLRNAQAGVPAVITVRCKDVFGNAIDADPRTRFWMELRESSGGGSMAHGGGGDGSGRPGAARGLGACEAVWADDGLFELKYVTSKAGTFDVVLWCEHEGMPSEVLVATRVLSVAPAAPTPLTSAIQHVGSLHGRALRAGSRIALPLLLIDTYGNDAADTSQLEISLSGPDGSGEVSALSARALPEHERTPPPSSARAAGRSLAAGAASADSPRSPRSPRSATPRSSARSSPRFSARSPPRLASAAVTCCAVSTASAGDPHRSTTSPSGGAAAGALSAAAAASGGGSLPPRAANVVSGVDDELTGMDVDELGGTDAGGSSALRCTHVIEHTATTKGVFYLSVSLGGRPLRGSPLEFHVTAGGANGARSVLQPAPMPMLNHVPSIFMVQACDRWSNALVTGGATVAARTNGPGAVQCVVSDLTDGTYSISLVASCSGEYRLIVSLDGQQVLGSPHLVSVVHGGPPPDNFQPPTPRHQVNRQRVAHHGASTPVKALSPPSAAHSPTSTPRAKALGPPADAPPSAHHPAVGPDGRRCVEALSRSASQPLMPPSASPRPPPPSAVSAASAALQETAGGRPGAMGHAMPRRTEQHLTASISTPRYLQDTSASRIASVRGKVVSHYGRCCNPRQSFTVASEVREVRQPEYPAFDGLSRLESQQRSELYSRLSTPRTREPPSGASTPRGGNALTSSARRSAGGGAGGGGGGGGGMPPPPPPSGFAFRGGEPEPQYPLHHRGEPPPQGVASAAHSFVSGPMEVATGRAAALLIAACDGYGVPLQRGGDAFVASVHGPAACHTELRDLEDGRYELHVLAPSLSGDFRVSVTLRGRPIGGSPHALNVLAPVAHPNHCEAHGAALELATAGEPASFELVAHDAHNKPMAYGGEQFSVRLVRHANLDQPAPPHLVGKRRGGKGGRGGKAGNSWGGRRRGGGGGGGEEEEEEALETFGRVEDRRDGTYVASYVASRSGRYTLHVTSLKAGRPIKGSPWALLVAPGPTHAPSCFLRGRELGRSVAGELTSFELIARDGKGNHQLFGGEPWVAVLQGPYPTDGPPLDVKVVDRGEGTYRGSFALALAGEYSLSVTLRGSHVRGSPLRVSAAAAGVHAGRCYAEGAGLRAAFVRQTTTFKILAKDAFGNRVSRGAHGYNVRVRPPLSATKAPDVVVFDLGDGTCGVEWVPQVRGRHVVSVTLGGLPIEGSDFMCHVA